MEQRVVFTAIARFSQARREARALKRELADLKREQVQGNVAATASQDQQARSTKGLLGEIAKLGYSAQPPPQPP